MFPVNGIDPTGNEFSLGGLGVSMSIGSFNNSMGAIGSYVAKQGAQAGLETALEVVIGKLISVATGVPFDMNPDELDRSFNTNFVSNLVTAGIGNKANKAILIRNLIDFGIRMVSDVAFGNQSIMWASAVNLISIDRKSTRLNSSHGGISRMPSSA